MRLYIYASPKAFLKSPYIKAEAPVGEQLASRLTNRLVLSCIRYDIL